MDKKILVTIGRAQDAAESAAALVSMNEAEEFKLAMPVAIVSIALSLSAIANLMAVEAKEKGLDRRETTYRAENY